MLVQGKDKFIFFPGGIHLCVVFHLKRNGKVFKHLVLTKGDVGNAIYNTQSKTASATSSACNVPIGVFLLW